MKTLSVFTIFLWGLFANTINAQSNYQNYLTRAALETDLEILKFQLEQVHAGLYEYSEKTVIDSAFLEIKNNLKDDMTDLDFYRVLAPLQRKIKNGHTMVIPSEQWSNYKVRTLPLFPFEVYWHQEKLYILKNLSSDNAILDGTEILSINGLPIKAVVDKLVANITRDGNNRTYPLHLMSVGFEHWYADIIDTPTRYQLELRPIGSQQSYRQDIKALKESEMNAYHLKRYGQERVAWFLRPNATQLSLSINGNSAILHVPTFDRDERSAKGEKYARFYKRAFAQIKAAGVENLILDLRDNGGGDPMPQLALLSHLLEEPVRLYKRSYAIMQKIPNPELYPHDKIRQLNRVAKLVLRKEGAVYEINHNIFSRMQGTPPKKAMKIKKNRFAGKLYVLVNGASFSATGEVAGILKDRQRGIFIGEETGGSDWQNTSGRMPMLYLPNSGVRIRMPIIAFALNVENSDDAQGVIPEYTFSNSIEDEIQQRDAVMEFTFSLIRKKETVMRTISLNNPPDVEN